MRRADGAAGFTLIELLVALTIMGVIAAGMASALRFMVRAFERTDAQRAAVESLSTGLGAVRTGLTQALPLRRRVGDQALRVVFEGRPDRVRFATVRPPFVEGPPLEAVEYTIAYARGRSTVFVRTTSLDPASLDLAVLDEAPAIPVMAFLGELQLTYFGREEALEPPAWSGSWRTPERLPQAVRLAPPGLEPTWPEIVVPLAVDLPAGCVAGATTADTAAEGGEAETPLARAAEEEGQPIEEAAGGAESGGGNADPGCV